VCVLKEGQFTCIKHTLTRRVRPGRPNLFHGPVVLSTENLRANSSLVIVNLILVLFQSVNEKKNVNDCVPSLVNGQTKADSDTRVDTFRAGQ
jgi:hypothetical protein